METQESEANWVYRGVFLEDSGSYQLALKQ
jgi:hypothetical protein